MSEKERLLTLALEENWKHEKFAEGQRAVIAAINLLVASTIHVALAFTGFSLKALPLTVWLVPLGIYGIATSLKLYERSQFHNYRAKEIRAHLDPDGEVEECYRQAEEKHRKRYPRLTDIRLNNMWLALHTLIALLGILYTVLCLTAK